MTKKPKGAKPRKVTEAMLFRELCSDYCARRKCCRDQEAHCHVADAIDTIITKFSGMVID